MFAAYLGFALIQLHHDKAMHFWAFLVLTVEFYFIFVTKRKELKILRYATFLICTVGASIGLEILQNMVNPTRVFDVNDIICNFTGSLVGLGLASGYLNWSLKRQRSQNLYHQQIEPVTENTRTEGEDYVKIELDDVAEQA